MLEGDFFWQRFYGFWESIYNPNSKPIEFEGFRKQAGDYFSLRFNDYFSGEIYGLATCWQ